MIDKNVLLFQEAQRHIPGGVNSPVRAFKSVGGTPIFVKKAKGAYLYDENDKQYIDYIASWGPLILGHAYEPVVEAIQKQVERGTSYGIPTALETDIAKLIKAMAPNIDLIRMVNSGTEACMSALRVARGYTGKNKFIKFEGCYHGHADPFLVKGGSGIATLNIESVPGVSAAVASDTLTATYNDIDEVYQLVEKHKGEIAAIILEPVAGNMGCILPQENFLSGLRKICDAENMLLIFDEVMTGFRLAKGGAQELFQVDADLVTYGKVIGAGLPVGAFGGKKHIMESVAPLGKVYQGGTLSGNPLAMIAGFTLLSELNENGDAIYKQLADKTAYLRAGLQKAFDRNGIPVAINSVGSMISVHFTDGPVSDFGTAARCDHARFSQFFHHMLAAGIYLPPSSYESWFLNNALGYGDLDRTIEVVGRFGG